MLGALIVAIFNVVYTFLKDLLFLETFFLLVLLLQLESLLTLLGHFLLIYLLQIRRVFLLIFNELPYLKPMLAILLGKFWHFVVLVIGRW